MKPAQFLLSLPSNWRGKSPGLPELIGLINLRPDSSLIIDRSSSNIIIANSAFFRLTAFSQNDLSKKQIQEIIPDISLNSEDFEEQTLVLNLHLRGSLPVTIHINPLDETSKWLLVTVIPNAEKEDVFQFRKEEIFNLMAETAKLFDLPDLRSAIQKSLEVFIKILGASFACIYENDGSFPRLVKKAALESGQLLPESLPSSDLVRLSNPQVWLPGKRMLTELHRMARVSEVSYLASIPLGTEGAFLGLLVVGDYQRQPKTHLLDMVKILGAQLNSIYHHFILVDNLIKLIDDNGRLLLVRNTQVENAQEAILVLQPDLKVAEVNPAAELMFEYANQEVHDQPIENILIGTDRLMPALEASIAGRPPQNLGIVSLHRRSGESFPAILDIIPLAKEEELLGILIYVNDVSESENFRKRTEQLENRATLGDFIALFAHEVRNPVNNISLGLEVLSVKHEPDDPSQETISRMQNDCQRLEHLMEDVLAWNRHSEPHFSDVNLVDFLRHILDRWRPRFFKANVTPIFQAAENLPHILADPRMLDQVFVNLISNATEAMNKTGGTLTIRIAPSNAIANLPQLEVTVSDNGPGIPDDVRDHIFEPFYTTKTRGTGLGLSITSRIVNSHRGSISVTSCPGGTVFHILLPIAVTEV
jgi:two-component system, NtrC family, sensor histidine kinase AtoS